MMVKIALILVLTLAPTVHADASWTCQGTCGVFSSREIQPPAESAAWIVGMHGVGATQEGAFEDLVQRCDKLSHGDQRSKVAWGFTLNHEGNWLSQKLDLRSACIPR